MIVPAYTFPATANVVRLAGATPVLVDVDPATFNLDVAKVYEAVTPRTKAVLAVHLFGRPLDWEELQNAVPPEVLLLEDAAGALGARWRGMPCGGLGTMGCLSFHPRKIVTTGEGGAVTTNDAELAASIRRLRHHGLDPAADIAEPSTNYRLADILCAIGIPQLRRLDELLAERARVAAGYTERLAGLVDVPAADEGDTHGWQAYVIRLDRRVRRWRRCGRRGSRCRSGRTRSTTCRPTATRGRSRSRRGLRARARAAAALAADRLRPRSRRRGDRPVRLTGGVVSEYSLL